MDKIILIHYIYVGDMDYDTISNHMDMIRENVIPKDADIISYLIPIRTGETYIECVNPKLVKEDAWHNVKTILDRNQKALDKFLQNKKEENGLQKDT